MTSPIAPQISTEDLNIVASLDKTPEVKVSTIEVVDAADSPSRRYGISYVDADTPQFLQYKGTEYAIISPYNHVENMLALKAVEIECQILALALWDMRATTDEYATESYEDSFNWSRVTKKVRKIAKEYNHEWTRTKFYAVTFRSRIPPSTDRSRLSLLDFKAHQEAVASGGLLKYWFGAANGLGQNLATCIWRHPDDAKKGGTGPWHRQAMKETRHLYQEWKFEKWALVIDEGAQRWSLEPWTD